jgi:endonuclease G
MSQGQNNHIIRRRKLVEMLENIGWKYAMLVFRNLITNGTKNSTTNWLAVSVLLFAIVVLPAAATTGVTNQMLLGNPSNAISDTNNHDHYLIQRTVEAIDYSDNLHEPNWASWDLTASDVGSSGRGDFLTDTNLPPNFYWVKTSDYTYSGYDRGHMCPSADRTDNTTNNDLVFLMSNIIPQAPDNNQGVWANLETYCRTLASAGNELLIICGPNGFSGSRINTNGPVFIPSYTWKIIVVVTNGSGTALNRIDTSTRVIAVNIPNIAGIRSAPWTNYPVSVNQLQTNTGFTFFNALPPYTAAVLRAKIDGQPIPVVAPQISGGVANSNNFAFSWPTAATGFILQQNSNLTTTNWTPYGGTITTNGDMESATISTSDGNNFFRLMHP